jgi:oligoribonuclease NrnB/cAMP/cGMP phosphodiesterase (DHH superfamily)
MPGTCRFDGVAAPEGLCHDPAAMPKIVHIVSHGPTCLDGVTAAAAVARYYEGRAQVQARFASNSEIDAVLQSLRLDGEADRELWITDISWRDPATDEHLRTLARHGVRIYWIDHHRTALERARTGRVDVPFADTVLSEEFAASRLTYEYLGARLAREGRQEPRFTAFAPVVAMADDNDRWLHRVPGSRELAWVVRVLGPDAYEDFMTLDEHVTYTPRMAAARARVGAEIERSFAVANASRVEQYAAGVRVVAAVCDGHPSEIADAWGKETPGAVFALWDATSLSVSLRRSPDCTVDLSKVAEALGGGGHAAASGAELPDLRHIIAEIIATRVAERLR